MSIDTLRFRGTTSIDIRAPTLDDLFRPATLLQNVFTDLHIPDPTKPPDPQPAILCRHDHLQQPGQSQTGAGSVAYLYDGCGMDTGLRSGPDHVAGLLPHPSWPTRSGPIAPSTTIQTICEESGGTSIYCANYQRPLPFSDHTHREFRDQALHLQSQHRLHPDRGLGLRDQLWLADVGHGGGLAGLVECAPAGDLSAGHQQIGAFPRRALDSRARSQHPHHRRS